MKIEKLYSDYDEYYDEKLYSTGNDELDDLLERAFCDGYEYAQREFGSISEGIKKFVGTRPKELKSKIAQGASQWRKGSAAVREGYAKAGDIYRKAGNAVEEAGKYGSKVSNAIYNRGSKYATLANKDLRDLKAGALKAQRRTRDIMNS